MKNSDATVRKVTQLPEKKKNEKTPEQLKRESVENKKKAFTADLKAMCPDIIWDLSTDSNVIIGTLGYIAYVFLVGKFNIITGIKTVMDRGYRLQISASQEGEVFHGVFINKQIEREEITAQKRAKKNKTSTDVTNISQGKTKTALAWEID